MNTVIETKTCTSCKKDCSRNSMRLVTLPLPVVGGFTMELMCNNCSSLWTENQ